MRTWNIRYDIWYMIYEKIYDNMTFDIWEYEIGDMRYEIWNMR